MIKLFLPGKYCSHTPFARKTISGQTLRLSKLGCRSGFHWKGVLIALSLSLGACSTLQVAPIQMARIAQLETFRHTFVFGSDARPVGMPAPVDYFDPATLDINQKIKRKFTLLLGKDNWQTLKDIYSLSEIRDELIHQEIDIQGVAQMYLSIDPYDHQQFLIEGTGKYFLIRKKNDAILLAGDFFVLPDTHKIAELDKGELILKAALFPTQIAGQITYYYPAKVRYRIKIDTSRKEENIYSLDYEAFHDVYLLQKEGEALTQDNKLGELRLGDLEHGPSKLLDLRGIKFLHSDY